MMSEMVTLSGLQIKRRELENELASLSQTEKMLESDLRTLEGKIIGQLREEIEAKKSTLRSLESKKSDLEKKLNVLQDKPASSQMAEERPANNETKRVAQQNDTTENGNELTVIGYQQE
ncbi:MAG: hypothetical protein ACWGNP_04570 [Candidatus Bathyarchaeia archaeon]